jgi:serine/threonine protein kinase
MCWFRFLRWFTRSRLNKYRMITRTDRTRFGYIVQSKERKTGRDVAIKCSSLEQLGNTPFSENTIREAAIYYQLQTPDASKGIVQCFESFEENKKHYMVLEFADLGDLQKKMTTRHMFSQRTAVLLFRDIAVGVAHMKKRKVVHLDISAENILLFSGRDGIRAKISDFGMARICDTVENEASLSGRYGKPMYMCPEMIAGKHYSGFAADVFSIGIVFFILLVGFPPFEKASKSCFYFCAFLNGHLTKILKRHNVSCPLTVDLLTKMFQPEMGRILIEDVLQHPLFLQYDCKGHSVCDAPCTNPSASLEKNRGPVDPVNVGVSFHHVLHDT